MTLRELVAQAEALLQTSPHPERARRDAETLLLNALGQDRAWFLAHWDDEAEESLHEAYIAAIARRQTGEPIQYITGQSDFYGIPFSVGPGVLIPRPETEHLVEEVIRLATQWPEPRIADIGTGSGIIAVALATELPSALLTAVDRSVQALVIARDNAQLNHVENRIDFLESDLLSALEGRSFHIIASNPPYIPENDRDSLSVEVRDYEPHTALFAGPDGLAIYSQLIPEARNFLDPYGWLVLEIGYNQESAIEALLKASGYQSIYFISDYQGIPRVAVAQRI